MLDIYVDADGCPVKEETYRVAERYGLKAILVANSRMRAPDTAKRFAFAEEDWIELVVVDGGFDAADDWIVEHVQENDIVITCCEALRVRRGDIPLADRCLKRGARAISPRGRVYREDSIGQAVATRDVLAYLREIGVDSGGPAPFEKRDRSQFLQRLDETVQAIWRGK